MMRLLSVVARSQGPLDSATRPTRPPKLCTLTRLAHEVRISDEPLRPCTLLRFDSCQALCGGSLVRPPMACTRVHPCALIGRSGGAL